jgi:hypothetical protein
MGEAAANNIKTLKKKDGVRENNSKLFFGVIAIETRTPKRAKKSHSKSHRCVGNAET